MVGPDNNVYVTIGDVGIDGHDTKAQNVQNGLDADGTEWHTRNLVRMVAHI
jgi:hypothetical protein